jgi:hypothetical protein
LIINVPIDLPPTVGRGRYNIREQKKNRKQKRKENTNMIFFIGSFIVGTIILVGSPIVAMIIKD